MQRIFLITIFLLCLCGAAHAQGPSVAIKTVTVLPSTCRANAVYTEQVFKKAADATRGFYTCKSTQDGWDGPYASSGGAAPGSVTSVSVVSASGQSGTVATPTTTPAITLNNPTVLVATTSVQSPFFVTNASDPADGSAVRLGNNEFIAWEKFTPGTDWTLGVNASDILNSSAPFQAPRIGLGIAPDANTILDVLSGAADAYAAYVQNNNVSAGHNFGQIIIAGSSSADYPLRVQKKDATDYFSVRGDGVVLANISLTIGGGSPITSSGAGGALGTNAFNSTSFEATANKDAASGYAGLTAGSLLKSAELPGFTGGDVSSSNGSSVLTLASVISAGGPTGSATVTPVITYDAKGRLTTVTTATIAPPVSAITGFGTGVAAALAVNGGSAGAFITFNGNAGTPSALVGTNISGTGASFTAGAVTGFTAGAGVLTGPASAGVAATLGNNETFAGIKTFSPTARSSGSAAYFTINVPADTGISTATESIGENHVTGTRTWVDGTVALQRERFWAGPTYNKTTTSATFTDVFNAYFTPPIAGTGVTFTRGHTLGIVDSTSAASSITGAFIVANTLGTTATSVGIGGGNINAGGNGTFGGTINGLTITNNGTNTLNIAAGKSLALSNTLTFTGTDSSSVAFSAGGTVAYSVTPGNGVSATNTAGALAFTLAAITPSTIVATSSIQGTKLSAGIAPIAVAFAQVKVSSGNDFIVRAGTDFGGSYTGIGLDAVDDSASARVMMVIRGTSVRFPDPVYIPGITTSAGLQTAVLCQSSGGEMIADSVACLASSARFKNQIKPLRSGLDEIMALRPVSFHYKPEGIFANNKNFQRERLGLIAEEVNNIDPRLVGYENDGTTPRTVGYDQVTMVLLSGMQAQQKQILKLQEQVNEKNNLNRHPVRRHRSR